MMHRNLDRRVEVLVRVTDTEHRSRLRSLLDLAVADASAWALRADGSWTRGKADPATPPLQEILMARARHAMIDR